MKRVLGIFSLVVLSILFLAPASAKSNDLTSVHKCLSQDYLVCVQDGASINQIPELSRALNDQGKVAVVTDIFINDNKVDPLKLVKDLAVEHNVEKLILVIDSSYDSLYVYPNSEEHDALVSKLQKTGYSDAGDAIMSYVNRGYYLFPNSGNNVDKIFNIFIPLMMVSGFLFLFFLFNRRRY